MDMLLTDRVLFEVLDCVREEVEESTIKPSHGLFHLSFVPGSV